LRRRALNICQFKRNPHHETSTRARFNPKHIDERVRIIEETTGKIPQTVLRWHVSRWGCVRLDTGKGFGRTGEVSTIVINAILIILDLWSKRVFLSWDNFGTSDVLIHVHIWNNWIRWRGRVIVYHIVIGCIDVSWILHFTLHNHVSYRLKDSLPVSTLQVITSHMRVLRYETKSERSR